MSNGFTQAQKNALMKLPGFKEIKEQYSQAGMGKRKRGGGFWDDLWNGIKSAAKSVDAWLTRTKALSTAGKVIGAITAVIPGLQEVAPIALGAAKAASEMGYGKKKMGGRKTMTANDLGQHVNPVAGTHGLVSQGMGFKINPSDVIGMYNPLLGTAARTLGYGSYNEEDFLKKADKYFPNYRKWYMAQKYQSPAMKQLGGTYPSHMQPFLTTKKVGMGVAQAVGSIGNPTRIIM